MNAPSPRPEELLTPRELDVLDLIVQGYTNRQVADELKLSMRTVEGYRANLTDKLGLRNRADLVRYARKHGLLSGPGAARQSSLVTLGLQRGPAENTGPRCCAQRPVFFAGTGMPKNPNELRYSLSSRSSIIIGDIPLFLVQRCTLWRTSP